jgi:hypothetical protein
MKSIVVILIALAGIQNAQAAEGVENCYAKGGEYFVSKLEDISQNKQTPVLLLNSKKEVVGVIAVEPERDVADPNKVKSINVASISLCATDLAVDDFYYADDIAADLKKWLGAGKDAIEITQDEGLLVLNASVAKKETYATLVKVTFKGYDVFNEDEQETNAEKYNPDYIEDWRLPKGKGVFYFYMPANWLK